MRQLLSHLQSPAEEEDSGGSSAAAQEAAEQRGNKSKKQEGVRKETKKGRFTASVIYLVRQLQDKVTG